MCLHFSGLSPVLAVWQTLRVYTMTQLRRSYINIYDAQTSSSCLIGTSPTALRPSRDQYHVTSILTPDMQAPAKQVVLANTKNKLQLDAMLTESSLDPGYFTEAKQMHTLTIAGVRDVSVEITGGRRIDRHDLRSTHEEADILIAQYAISLLLLGKSVRLCATTYVCVLLVHYYSSMCKGSNIAPMITSSPVKERAVIYIRVHVDSAHSDITDDLLAIHALSGADTVAPFHGIGKATVVKVAEKRGFLLFRIDDVHALNMLRPSPYRSCCCIWQGSRVIKLHDRMQCQNVALKNREEWCIISETLSHSTN